MSTIKEVAERAGVSVTTVSRTLNDRGYISQRTRERIRRAMDELNYRPNEVARSLSFQHTRMIGVLVPEINSYFSPVVSCLSHALTAKGYKMLLYVASGTDDSAPDYVSMLRSNQVDGMIVALRGRRIERDLVHQLPVVSFENLLSLGFPSVLCDNLEGGRLAARELLDCGSRRPLMIAGRNAVENMPAFERFRGFRETVEAAGLEARILDLDAETPRGDYLAAAGAAFRRFPDADGIFCSSDAVAAYVLQEAARLGKTVPGDVRIIGFNDSPVASLCAIPLTSVRQPLPEMCEAAVDCLLKQIAHEPFSTRMLFPVQLIRRASTRGFAPQNGGQH